MARKLPYFARLLHAMQMHGELSEPDMEVGDLQGLARDLWDLLTKKQQVAFAQREDYRDIIRHWGEGR